MLINYCYQFGLGVKMGQNIIQKALMTFSKHPSPIYYTFASLFILISQIPVQALCDEFGHL